MVVRVTVYDTRIEAAFWPGGTLFQNVRRIGNKNLQFARSLAPGRTGALRASLYCAVTPSGKYHARYSVGSKLDYAIYTIAGTTGPIVAKGGSLLWIRPAPYSWFAYNRTSGFGGRTPMFHVRGQQGRDWLGRSMKLAMLAVDQSYV
jgi:hypothetical protein